MPTTVEYLDAVKVELGLQSDYAVSKVLSVTRATVSRYRRGASVFDDEVCFEVAMILDLNPFEVLVASHLERAKDAETKAKWLGYWKDFSARFTVARVSRDGIMRASQPGADRINRRPLDLPMLAPLGQDCEPTLSAAIGLLEQLRTAWSNSTPSRHEGSVDAEPGKSSTEALHQARQGRSSGKRRLRSSKV